MTPETLRKMDISALLVGAVIALAFWWFESAAAAASAAVGCALGVLNFAVIRFLVGKLIAGVQSGSTPVGYVGWFFLKLLVLGSALLLLSRLGSIQPLALVLGFLSVFVAVVLTAVGLRSSDDHGSDAEPTSQMVD